MTSANRRSGEHAAIGSEQGAGPLRIVLADDHPLLRAGLRRLIEERARMRIVGEAGDGEQACALIEQLKPDMLVVDFSMPLLNGAEVTRRARKHHPALRVIALSVHEDAAHIIRFLEAGAAGYVLKRSAGDELIHAIEVVERGGIYVDPALSNQPLGTYLGTPAGDSPHPALSARELTVLRLTARGHANKWIAAQLTVSIRTVETYRARAMAKLGIRTREQLVRFAVERGLLDGP